MKTAVTILFILAMISIIPGFQSCQKESPGPVVSSNSSVHKVANTWQVESYKINQEDQTSSVLDYVEVFSESGDYFYSWRGVDGFGKWSFQNNDKEIQLSGSDSQASRRLYILKLEEKSFWYYYIESGDRHEFHLIGQTQTNE